MAEVEDELFKLGVPVKTRHNEVAPSQYEIAPIFENANLATDHQMMTMEVLQAHRAAVRPGLPAAREAVRRHQRLRQAQQLVDERRARATTCSTPATRRTTTSSSWSSASPSSAPSTSSRGCCASASPAPGNDHRLGANEAPPAIISIFLGDSSRTSSSRSSRARRAAPSRAACSRPASRCCRSCRATPATATAPARSRSPATSSSSARCRRTRASPSRTSCSTWPSPSRSTTSPPSSRRPSPRAATLEEAVGKLLVEARQGEQAGHLQRQQLLRGVAQGGREARPAQPAQHGRRAAGADHEPRSSKLFEKYKVLNERELEAATRSTSRPTTRRSTSRPS